MRMICLGSSSKGNCYILTNGKEALVLEAGVPFKEVEKALDYNIGMISACLTSHDHGDHAKYVDEYTKAYVRVYGSTETSERSHRVCSVEGMTEVNNQAGRFYFRPFKVEHDVECYGYYIYHPDMGFLMFVTDTSYIRQRFARIDHAMIECNYDIDILDENWNKGKVTKVQRDRVIGSHMSKQTCIETLLANNLAYCKNIVLLHMSDGNSNEEEFVNAVVNATGTNVVAADRGVVVELSKEAI